MERSFILIREDTNEALVGSGMTYRSDSWEWKPMEELQEPGDHRVALFPSRNYAHKVATGMMKTRPSLQIQVHRVLVQQSIQPLEEIV